VITVHLVHGFNVKNLGATTTDKLRTHFESRGFLVRETNFGYRGLFGVRFGNDKRAEQLAAEIKPGDILVGHSDGCNLICMALWILNGLGITDQVSTVFFNPALDRDTPMPAIVKSALVFHTKSDKVVWFSKLLLWHRWGQMGRLGAVGGVFINCPYERLGLAGLGHSGVFLNDYRLFSCMGVFDIWYFDPGRAKKFIET